MIPARRFLFQQHRTTLINTSDFNAPVINFCATVIKFSIINLYHSSTTIYFSTPFLDSVAP
jgi:hypothetical protein